MLLEINMAANKQEFKVVGHVGDGAFGEVYKIEHCGETRVLKCNYVSDRCSLMDSIREACVLGVLRGLKYFSELKDLKVSTKIDVGKFRRPSPDNGYRTGRMMFIMEIEESSLTEYFKKRLTDDFSVKAFIRKILIALSLMNDRHIAHRDLTPSNILVSKRDGKLEFKLCDFGMTEFFCDGAPSSGTVTTWWYRAPEVNKGSHKKNLDVWSLAMIVHEMVRGFPLMRGGGSETYTGKLLTVPGISEEDAKFLEKGASTTSDSIERWKAFFRPTCGKSHKLFGQLTDEFFDLIKEMMKMRPEERPCAKDLLKHPYFGDDESQEEIKEAGIGKFEYVEHEFDKIDAPKMLERLDKATKYKDLRIISHAMRFFKTIQDEEVCLYTSYHIFSKEVNTCIEEYFGKDYSNEELIRMDQSQVDLLNTLRWNVYRPSFVERMINEGRSVEEIKGELRKFL